MSDPRIQPARERPAGRAGRPATTSDRFLPTDVGRFGSIDEPDRSTSPKPLRRHPNPGRLVDSVLTQREVIRRAWDKKRRLESRTRKAGPTPDPSDCSLQRLVLELIRRLSSLAFDLARQAIALLTRLLNKRR